MYRSDVVSSLLRPMSLKEARTQHEAGALSDAAFKQIEDRAVSEAVA
jgi:5-methyltetrahydropteroyltriglutamate--homocysteine methyltransferase